MKNQGFWRIQLLWSRSLSQKRFWPRAGHKTRGDSITADKRTICGILLLPTAHSPSLFLEWPQIQCCLPSSFKDRVFALFSRPLKREEALGWTLLCSTLFKCLLPVTRSCDSSCQRRKRRGLARCRTAEDWKQFKQTRADRFGASGYPTGGDTPEKTVVCRNKCSRR